MPSKRNVRNNGLKTKKGYSNFEIIGTPIQNHPATYDQNVKNDMETVFHRYQLATGRTYKNIEQ